MSPVNKAVARALQGAPRLVTATIALMEELVRVLLQEIEVVSQRKIKEHPELLKYKQRLAMDYSINMKELNGQPQLLKNLGLEAKDALRAMARQLAEAADANARILRGAVMATQQLIQNIMAMVKAEAIPRQSYKNPAKAHLQLGNYSPTCRPVAVNRTA